MKSKQYNKPKTVHLVTTCETDINIRKKAHCFQDSYSIQPPLSVYSRPLRQETGDNWYFYLDM